jgi:hypothetical protein
MDPKERLLKEAGYLYNFERMAYINREARKVFAAESVDDHSEEWLAGKIGEPNTSGSWKLYDEPPVAVRRALVAELEDARVTHR